MAMISYPAPSRRRSDMRVSDESLLTAIECDGESIDVEEIEAVEG
jgi:hypothetical protein